MQHCYTYGIYFWKHTGKITAWQENYDHTDLVGRNEILWNYP